MLSSTHAYKNRVHKFVGSHISGKRFKKPIRPKRIRWPEILRDVSELDMRKSIENLRTHLISRERISRLTQINLHRTIDGILFEKQFLSCVDGGTSSGSSAGSSSQEPTKMESDGSEILPNPEQQQEADKIEFEEIEPVEINPSDLYAGTPDFHKFVDQLRDDLLAVLVPGTTEQPFAHFGNKRRMKFHFVCVLRSAGICKRRYVNSIVVSVRK